MKKKKILVGQKTVKIFAKLPDYRSSKSPTAAAPNCASSTPTNLKLFCVCSTYIILCKKREKMHSSDARDSHLYKKAENPPPPSPGPASSLSLLPLPCSPRTKTLLVQSRILIKKRHISAAPIWFLNDCIINRQKTSTVGKYCLHWETTTMARKSI